MFQIHYLNNISQQGTALWTEDFALTGDMEKADGIVLRSGGLEEMKAYNVKKASILYDYLDSSRLFHGTVVKQDRSLMNVPFVTGDTELDAKFVREATEAGFVNLKGHRTVGGMRASIYNAMPLEGVKALVAFMDDFEKRRK